MGNIKSIKYVGEEQTYDLEVDHPDHQFYLSNGILTSNSHAVVYSMVSYQTAYLKAHFPIEFLLANLMSEVKSNAPNAEANIDKIKKEIRAKNVKIIAPDINKSQLAYTIENNNELITGLDAIKFVSDDAIKDILEKRPFTSFFDFMSRVSSKKVRANAIQALIAAGAMDSFKIPRKLMFLYCSDYRKKLQTWLKKHDPTKEEFNYPWVPNEEWSYPELYALEYKYIGEGFICGKLHAYGEFFKKPHNLLGKLHKAKDKAVIMSIKGQIKDFFEFKIKKEGSKYYGQSMIKAIVEDVNGDQCSLTIFPKNWVATQAKIKQLTKNKHVFEPGVAIHFNATVNIYDGSTGLILEELIDFAPIPQCPTDLKAKKVVLKTKKIKEKPEEEKTQQEIVDELEENLINNGLLDIDKEDEDG